MLNFLKRDQAKDPFGGDDGFDGESRFAGKGPKIALAASVVMFLALAGGIAAILMTGKAAPPPVAGSLSDIEVVEEPAGAPAQEAPAKTAANDKAATAADASKAAMADATAATDRSTDRRPWLTTPATAEKRPGVSETPKTAPPPQKAPEIKAAETKAPETKAPEAKTALMTPPPPSKSEPGKAPAAKAPEAKTVEAKAAETKMPETKAPEAKAAEAPPAKDTPKEVADGSQFGPAPGAPSLFNTPAGADAGPAVAGGRPRLVDPAEPPIDKTAISAPPPRFANIIVPKKDAAATKPVGTAKVAVVIDGLGLSQSATDAAITKLPAAVTLAFSPYTRNLKKWTEKAKAGGHEVLIEVPMESKEFPAEDPGPLGLLTSVEAKENAKRLDAILKDAGDAVGVFDADGSKFRESEPHINAVFTTLKEKNLFYVQGEPGVRVGEPTVPVAVADVVLDERPFRAAVDARLDYAERLARYQGSAVAAVGAKPVGFERLVLWMEQAQKKGVVLAPISEVLIRSEAANAPAAPATAPAKGKAGEHEAPPAKGKAEPKGKTTH